MTVAAGGELTCSHCGVLFAGSKGQIGRYKAQKSERFACSSICWKAIIGPRKKAIPERGPCETCGKTFFSRREKRFCDQSCYSKSPAFLAMLAAHNAARTTRLELACMECGHVSASKPSQRKKFCNQRCYRKFMAARFDRWIANPQALALPQCFDEFLQQGELSCMIEGCGWKGDHLSHHMNFAHGVRARDFKRAAGFNLTSGIMSKPLADRMAQRPQSMRPGDPRIILAPGTGANGSRGYHSLEGKEHSAKVRALMADVPGPSRVCEGCNGSFRQKTVFGRVKFCSTKCRDRHYHTLGARKVFVQQCAECAVSFMGTAQQESRVRKGLLVCCSHKCRNRMNVRVALAARGIHLPSEPQNSP